MPSIVKESSELIARKLALVNQQVQEQANGLLVVALDFTAAAIREPAVRPLFAPDSPPPIAPTAVNVDVLQNNRIYMSDAAFEIKHGLLHISATYYGALVSAQRSPFITYSYESRVTTVRKQSGLIAVGQILPTPQIQFDVAYDVYTMRVTIEKPSLSCAVVDRASVDVEQLLPLPRIVKATFTSIRLRQPDPEYTLDLRHRSLTALQLLEETNTAESLFSVEKQIDHQTRRVVVESYTGNRLLLDS
jgi:hypothetical protein